MNKNKEKIFTKINAQKFAVLASYDGSYPYCSLMSFYVSKDLKDIYIATSINTHKYQNILDYNKVSLLINDSSNRESDIKGSFSVTIFGDAEVVSENSANDIQNIFHGKYPVLRDFIAEKTTVFIKVKAKKYICIENFSEVSEITI